MALLPHILRTVGTSLRSREVTQSIAIQGTQAKVEQILTGYEPAISGRFYTNCRFPAYNYENACLRLIDAHANCGNRTPTINC